MKNTVEEFASTKPLSDRHCPTAELAGATKRTTLKNWWSADILNKILTSALLIATAGVASAGPVSNYYVSQSGQTISVIQGNSVINSWSVQNGCEWSLNVNGDIRTNPAGQNCGAGAQYTLGGTYTGVNYAEEVAGYQDTDDSTTDGQFNYTVSYATGDVIRTDRNFLGATTLFNSGIHSLGITYDETNNSLWIMDFLGTVVRNYSMTGNLLSSFNVIVGTGGLGLDHVDQTLWYVDSGGTLQQYSKTGQYLSSGINVGYVLGGEFDFAYANQNLPEPGTLALLGLGLAGLSLRRRKAY